jgi:hypothetical protein
MDEFSKTLKAMKSQMTQLARRPTQPMTARMGPSERECREALTRCRQISSMVARNMRGFCESSTARGHRIFCPLNAVMLTKSCGAFSAAAMASIRMPPPSREGKHLKRLTEKVLQLKRGGAKKRSNDQQIQLQRGMRLLSPFSLAGLGR